VSRSNFTAPPIELPPGRYRVYGFVPMTGLHLDKWIDVTEDNDPGCYGPANISIARAIPNLARILDSSGQQLWRSSSEAAK
jgi:hypothetical protein